MENKNQWNGIDGHWFLQHGNEVCVIENLALLGWWLNSLKSATISSQKNPEMDEGSSTANTAESTQPESWDQEEFQLQRNSEYIAAAK